MSEFRPTGFQMLPGAVKNLILINALVFLAQQVLPHTGFNMEDTFALHTLQSQLYKPWQLITHLFMHADIMHIALNMLALWIFGSVLENLWGPKRFLTFYIICGLGAALCHMALLFYQNQHIINEYAVINRQSPDYFKMLKAFLEKYNMQNEGYVSEKYAEVVINDNLNIPTIGASGAVFGCLAGFGYLFPNNQLYVYGLFPIKAKWLVIIYAGIEILATVQDDPGDNVAHVAHLGGALAGLIMVYFWNKKRW